MWQETSTELQLWLKVIEDNWIEISDFTFAIGMTIVAHWYDINMINVNRSIDWYLYNKHSKNLVYV